MSVTELESGQQASPETERPPVVNDRWIGGAGYRTCPANDQKTKHRADLHGHYGDLRFSRRGGRGRLGIAEIR